MDAIFHSIRIAGFFQLFIFYFLVHPEREQLTRISSGFVSIMMIR
jgi:hypothetical protein